MSTTPVTKDGAALFDLARRDRRHLFNGSRLRAGIADAGLDAVIASTAASMTYTTGAWMPLSILSAFAVTTVDDRQGIVVNEADDYFLSEYSWVEDIRSFRFGDSADVALSLLRELLSDLGLDRGTIGIELGSIPIDVHRALLENFPDVTWCDAGPVFEHARLVKTEGEIELFRAAAYMTDKAITTGFALVKPGDTEKELAAAMQSAALRFGADNLLHAHVHAGKHSTIVHTLSLEEPMRQGEVVHVDFGAVFAGYQTDLSRNAVIGAPDANQERIYQNLWEIHQVVIDAVKPGIPAEHLFQVVQPEFEKRGLVHPWGTMGHSTGLAIHEGFELSKGCQVPLEPGMILNVEPSHIEPDDARYHLEDSVLVTEDGCEVLSDYTSTERIFEIR
ncbi:MAG: Xaa-Pro dipeptidase [Gaiellales bacterium]|jgi:Xaa-Pro aminopeptidase/Xaa-Pro dipeptidase|nr:Xaa-Pro dipeptidase [Gaiellales bacterium]